jgi:nucleoside phosphorylase
VVVFAALGWECRPVLRALRNVRRLRVHGVHAWCGQAGIGEVWVVQTGVGVRRAAAAAAAIDLSACALVVSTGCAGGLAASLRPGDLVIASAVHGDGAAHIVDAATRARLLALADGSGLAIREGPIHCSATMLATRTAKAQAAATGALVVEMEATPLAAAAAAAARPFASVRAVIDAATDDVSLLTRVGDPDTGQVRPGALVAHIVRHPGAIAELRRLRRAQLAAGDALSRFFERWFAGELP